MTHVFRIFSLATALFLACCLCTLSQAPAGQETAPAQPKDKPQTPGSAVDPKWLERLPKEDRAAIDELIGYAPPPVTSDIKWVNHEGVEWEAQRGKVILVQSFTTGIPAARKWPTRLASMAGSWPANEIVLVALHTPEDAAKAEEMITRQKPPANVAIAIDSTGEFCDSLGIYKEPVNFVVDRNGIVRFAGLNPKGVEAAMAMLLAEPFDKDVRAKERPRTEPASEPEPSSKFPTFTDKVDSARDIRGQRAPEFFVDEWITTQPQARGKVVVLDFWATWCGPCVAAIPHMNSLATKFGQKVCIVGISDEKPNEFQEGLKKRKLKVEGFNYGLALDPAGKMKTAIQIRGIPHCIVMSQDWVVRWQGHPMSLRPQILEQIINADTGSNASGQPSKQRGWKHDS